MFLEENFRQFRRLDTLLGHAAQVLVQQVDGQVDLFEHGHQFGGLLVEGLGQTDLDAHGFVHAGLFFQLDQIDLAHQRCR